MKLYIYAIFDKKAGVYSTPFFSSHEQVAIRMVSGAMRDLSSSIGQFPADFQLDELGEWDDQSGALIQAKPRHVTELISLVQTDTQEPLAFFNKEAKK